MKKDEMLKKAEMLIRKYEIMKIIQGNEVHIYDIEKLIIYFEQNDWR